MKANVINYSVSADDDSGKMKKICDTTNLQLPSIENGTETLSGAGIMGEIDFPNMFKPGAMSFSLNQRIDSKDAASLYAPREHRIEVVWVSDAFDTNNAVVGIDSHKVVMKGVPKKYDPGKLEAGSPSDGSNELEIYYYKKVLNGETIIEIDKFNYVMKILGVDYSSKIRNILG